MTQYVKGGKILNDQLKNEFSLWATNNPAKEGESHSFNQWLSDRAIKKGDSITIIGRRWFDRINGNTYHSCECLINGKQVATVEFAYGYDRAYEYSGFKKLAELGYLPDWTHDTVIWRYCEERGIAYHATHSDVNRKKDL